MHCMQDCVRGRKGWDSEICGDQIVTLSVVKLQSCLTLKNCKVRNVGRAVARQNCSGHSRASSSLQSLQCRLGAPRRQAVSSTPRATHPPSGPTAESPHRIRTVRTMFADFAARGRSGLKSRELTWTAPVKLAAVQSSPWLQFGSYHPKPHNTTTDQRNRKREKTNNQTATVKRGREKPRRGGSDMAAPKNNTKRIQGRGSMPSSQGKHRSL